jgi:hypothetical protein
LSKKWEEINGGNKKWRRNGMEIYELEVGMHSGRSNQPKNPADMAL